MWFQNRRAKWRKQARLSLLQDAWRLRCLGLTSSSSMIGNEHQRQSPKLDASPSSPIPLSLTNASIPKMVDMKLLKDPSAPEECGQTNSNKTESFTLMHPAFQNVLHKRKYYGTHHGMDAASMFDKNCTDARNCGNLLANVLHSDVGRKVDSKFDHRLKTAKTDCDNGEMSQDSSGSEEIDLTSNGIDYSNNNNEPNGNHHRKSDKCTMDTF